MASSSAGASENGTHTLISKDDQGRVVILATGFCMVCSLLLLLTRLWIRWPLRTLFGRDDSVAVLGTGVAIIQSSLIIAAVPLGFGHRSPVNSQDATVEKMLFAGNIIYIAALCLGKLAVTLLFERLTGELFNPANMHRILTLVVAVWGAAAMLVLALANNISSPWTEGLKASMLSRWIAIEAAGAVIEIIIFTFALLLVQPLQMARSNKIQVVSGFCVRLPIIAIIVIRLYIYQQSLNDPDRQFALVMPEILTQVEMQYNLVSATLPCLRIFLKGFNTGYLGGRARGTTWTDDAPLVGTKGGGGIRLWPVPGIDKSKPATHDSGISGQTVTATISSTAVELSPDSR